MHSRKSLSKDEVLKLKNKYYTSFYCKDGICARTPYSYNEGIVEIPDKDGNLIRYITETCYYEKAIINECKNTTLYKSKIVSANCDTNAQCLSNLCVNRYCVHNEETPIVHCDDIYSNIIFEYSYMHCGKPKGAVCKKNKECSSKKCSNQYCDLQWDGPSDASANPLYGVLFYFVLFLIMISIFICISKCSEKRKKKKRNAIRIP